MAEKTKPRPLLTGALFVAGTRRHQAGMDSFVAQPGVFYPLVPLAQAPCQESLVPWSLKPDTPGKVPMPNYNTKKRGLNPIHENYLPPDVGRAHNVPPVVGVEYGI